MEGEFSQNLVAARLGGTVHSGKALDDAIPPRPPVMCAGCPHRGLFYTLNKNKCTVLGDTLNSNSVSFLPTIIFT